LEESATKAAHYKEKNLAVHIILKNKRWLNGRITELGAEFIMLREKKLGDMPIFFMEMEEIEPYDDKTRGKVEKSFYQS
jgi:hypothetical protein